MNATCSRCGREQPLDAHFEGVCVTCWREESKAQGAVLDALTAWMTALNQQVAANRLERETHAAALAAGKARDHGR
jgi:hypothetical protein